MITYMHNFNKKKKCSAFTKKKKKGVCVVWDIYESLAV